jgi:hypothetical protein
MSTTLIRYLALTTTSSLLANTYQEYISTTLEEETLLQTFGMHKLGMLVCQTLDLNRLKKNLVCKIPSMNTNFALYIEVLLKKKKTK